MLEISHLLTAGAGWSGALLTTGGYALVSRGRVLATSRVYQTANVVGGVLLAVSAVSVGAWPSVAANAVWLGIGTVALFAPRRRVAAAEEPPAPAVPRQFVGDPHC